MIRLPSVKQPSKLSDLENSSLSKKMLCSVEALSMSMTHATTLTTRSRCSKESAMMVTATRRKLRTGSTLQPISLRSKIHQLLSHGSTKSCISSITPKTKRSNCGTVWPTPKCRTRIASSRARPKTTTLHATCLELTAIRLRSW